MPKKSDKKMPAGYKMTASKKMPMPASKMPMMTKKTVKIKK